MQLAHTLGANGPDIEFLILAGALLILGIVFFTQESVKRSVSLVLVLASFALTAGAFAVGGNGDDSTGEAIAGTASISITSPPDGTEVTAGEPVTLSVEVENGSLTTEQESDDPSLGHLHVFVDGALDSMPTSGTPQVTLEPGEHEIVVEFTQANHASFEPRILDRIQLTAL